MSRGVQYFLGMEEDTKKTCEELFQGDMELMRRYGSSLVKFQIAVDLDHMAAIFLTYFLDMQPNAPIGLWPGLEYEGEEIETIKGRALFVYTDGLNEAENPQQEQFGDDRLLSILRNTHFDSAQQVIELLKTEVAHHRNGAEPNDDLKGEAVWITVK